MKCLLLPVALLCAASAAQAQLLPVPGTKNPDWALGKSEARPNAEPSDMLPGTDRMPNAMQKSIKSIGNRHYHWDASRQLAYEWQSRLGSGSVAPDKQVRVREERTGIAYVYRRRAHQ